VAGTSGYTIGQTMTLATFASTNDVRVKTWYDQSGNGRDLTNTTDAQQPALMTSGAFITYGGMPVVSCDGSAQDMTATFSRPATAGIICALQIQASGDGTVFAGLRTAGGDAYGTMQYINATGRAIYNGTFVRDTTTTDVGKHRIYGFLINGASSKGYVDGVETISGNAGANTGSDLRIGQTWNAVNASTKYHELLVFPDATTDLITVSTKMNAFWGIY
jgi:hypothetical protein